MSWGAIRLRYRDSKLTFFEGEASPAPGGGSMPVQTAEFNGLRADYPLPAAGVLLIDPSAKAWESGKTYSLETVGLTVQSVVHPSDDPDRRFQPCYLAEPVSADTEPAWVNSQGELTEDGEIAWGATAYTLWEADTIYGNVYVVAAGHVFLATQAGTSGSVEPDFASAPNLGDTVPDNDVTWTNVGVVSIWQPSTSYPWFVDDSGFARSDYVLPTAPAGFVFQMSTTIPPWAVSIGDEPDWSTVPPDSGQQVIGGGLVWEESSSPEQAALTGIVAPPGVTILTLGNSALPDSAATVKLLDDADVEANYSEFVRSAPGNRFGSGGPTVLTASGAESVESIPLPVMYANGQWQPPAGL